jgi:hypothetical protein
MRNFDNRKPGLLMTREHRTHSQATQPPSTVFDLNGKSLRSVSMRGRGTCDEGSSPAVDHRSDSS